MPSFDVCWNRSSLDWRRHSERAPWRQDAVLLERVILAGKAQLRIVCQIASILEDQLDDLAAREQFWINVRRRLGRLRRLSSCDIAEIERLLMARVPRPQPAGVAPMATRPSANPVNGPHQPLVWAFRAR